MRNIVQKTLSLFGKAALFLTIFCYHINPVYAATEASTITVEFNLTIAYLITTMISFILLISYIAFIKKRETLFVFLYSAVFVVNIGYTFQAASFTLSEALLANRVSYLGACFLPLFMMLIIAMECNVKYPRYFIGALIAISAVMYTITASPGYGTLYYKDVSLAFSNTGSVLVKTYGPLHKLYYVYLASYFTIMIATILYSYYRHSTTSMKLVMHLLACVFCNLGIWYLGQMFHFKFEFLSISYLVTETYLLSIYNMIEDIYDKEHSSLETTSINLVVEDKDDELKKTAIEINADTTNIDEIIRIWPDVALLTNREIEVFKLLIQNKKRKDIAEDLCVSENTVKKHTSNIFSKLKITNRSEIIHIISKIK